MSNRRSMGACASRASIKKVDAAPLDVAKPPAAAAVSHEMSAELASKSGAAAAASPSEPVPAPIAAQHTAALRIVHITDVYTLENFPSLRTLILEKRAEFCACHGDSSKTISMLTGDFLMPYLLSTVSAAALMRLPG